MSFVDFRDDLPNRIGKGEWKRAVNRNKTCVLSVSIPKGLHEEVLDFCHDEGIKKSHFVKKCIQEVLHKYRHQGYVYFLQWGDPDSNGVCKIKIGHTKSLNRRVSELAGTNHAIPEELKLRHHILCKDSGRVERILHGHFNTCRYPGTEYFLLTPHDLKWVQMEGYKKDIPQINDYLFKD